MRQIVNSKIGSSVLNVGYAQFSSGCMPCYQDCMLHFFQDMLPCNKPNLLSIENLHFWSSGNLGLYQKNLAPWWTAMELSPLTSHKSWHLQSPHGMNFCHKVGPCGYIHSHNVSTQMNVHPRKLNLPLSTQAPERNSPNKPSSA